MLNRLKAKITSLHGEKFQGVMLGNDEPNWLAGKRQRSFILFRCENDRKPE